MGRTKGTAQHKYTDEQLDFIRGNIKKMTWKELTKLFNKTYGTNLSYKALMSAGKRHGIKTGRVSQFQKGHEPWNKGLKGINFGGKETQFKPGHRPHTWLPIGSERITKDGYVEVKVRDIRGGQYYKNWKGKHVLIWEQYHGRPVPPGHAVIFADGNKRNFDPDNLLLVSRAQLVRMNQLGLVKNDVRLTRTGIIIADLLNRIGELRKRKKGTSKDLREARG